MERPQQARIKAVMNRYCLILGMAACFALPWLSRSTKCYAPCSDVSSCRITSCASCINDCTSTNPFGAALPRTLAMTSADLDSLASPVVTHTAARAAVY